MICTYSSCEGPQAVDDSVVGQQCRGVQHVVLEDNSVRDYHSIGRTLDKFVAPAVFKCQTHIESKLSAEVLRFSCRPFGIGNDP